MKKYILIICRLSAYLTSSYVPTNQNHDHASEKNPKTDSPKHEEHGTHENEKCEDGAEHKHSEYETEQHGCLASVVIGGIISSTLLKLIVLPILFSRFESRMKGKVAH